MKAIDTNVLVRFLVRDDEHQAALVYKRLKKAEINKEVLFVPLLVLFETIWVLESVYAVDRQAILESMGELLLMPVLQFETPTVIRGFIAAAQATTLDLSDLLIAHAAWRSGCGCVITLDKRAAKSEFLELLK